MLESPVGYEIILLQDKRDAMIAPYANVRDNIVKRIQTEGQAKAREAYLKGRELFHAKIRSLVR